VTVAHRGKALITGGAGFIGSNLADRLASDGYDVIVFDALARVGVERNLAWLEAHHPGRVRWVKADVRDRKAVTLAVDEADVVFHLAAQVAVTTSMDAPREDFEVNLLGTLNVLEAVREAARRIPVIFASTNKVYGDLGDIALELKGDAYVPIDRTIKENGVSEARPLEFHTPYGCSKGGADQYVLDYARSFGIPTCVLRMSCIYGPRQMGTEDQGWVAHFLLRALRREAISIYGDGRQVRDILHVNDAVAAYMAAWRQIEIVSGRAFNLGGGPKNAVSLRQVLECIETLVEHPIHLSYSEWRSGDQRYYVSNTSAAQQVLGFSAATPWRKGIADLAAWLNSEHFSSAPRMRAPAF
jgi:CDP-paratose 2-epimerase